MRRAQEEAEAKGQRAENTDMDSSQRHSDEDVKRETPAVSHAGPCSVCHLITGVALGTATVILLTGLLLYLVSCAPGPDQTSNRSGKELQQCQKERYDLTVMLHTVTQDSRCGVCPVGWLWWRSHCYFFSVGLEENRRWNKSAEFCRGHNSSLAVIEDSAEMDFIQGVMRKFPRLPFLWVGLTDCEQEGRWLWWDGADVQHYMPVTVEWDADHRDCADLRGGGSLFAADCEAYGPWFTEMFSGGMIVMSVRPSSGANRGYSFPLKVPMSTAVLTRMLLQETHIDVRTGLKMTSRLLGLAGLLGAELLARRSSSGSVQRTAPMELLWVTSASGSKLTPTGGGTKIFPLAPLSRMKQSSRTSSSFANGLFSDTLVIVMEPVASDT
ncbi:hypothetical protein INR49_011865 [Caranx melampygus]|nr:hypothetical protein INR49_011865 [Caranx melampygus]